MLLQREGGGDCLVDSRWTDADGVRWEEDCWPGSGEVFLVEDYEPEESEVCGAEDCRLDNGDVFLEEDY